MRCFFRIYFGVVFFKRKKKKEKIFNINFYFEFDFVNRVEVLWKFYVEIKLILVVDLYIYFRLG